MTKGLTMRLIPALLMFGFAGSAAASGFALQNQGGSGNGNAFAGAAAAAEDGSTIFFNPAGMTYLPTGHTVTGSLTVLDRSIKFKNQGTSAFPANNFGNTGDGGEAGGTAFLPHGYWSWSIAPDVWVGVGVGPTFGNKTEYDKNFIGKYAGYMTEIEQININPSLAIKVNDTLSLGLGVNFAYAKLHLKQGVPGLGAVAARTNYLDLESDGDWGMGFNIGAMFQLSPSTRVGVSYRSTVDFDINGKQKLHPNVGGVLVSQDITADGYKTPDTLSVAVSQKLSDRWELLGDWTWTGWSAIDELVVNQKSNDARVTSLSYNFDNTWRVGLGANYQYNDAWKFRFGVAHDKTPVRSAADRTMTLPDSDRTWLSLGAKYNLSKQASLDVGYSHIFFKDAKTARFINGTALGVGTSTVRGEWNNNRADLLSVQYNHTF